MRSSYNPFHPIDELNQLLAPYGLTAKDRCCGQLEMLIIEKNGKVFIEALRSELPTYTIIRLWEMYCLGYKRGFQDGKRNAQHDTAEL